MLPKNTEAIVLIAAWSWGSRVASGGGSPAGVLMVWIEFSSAGKVTEGHSRKKVKHKEGHKTKTCSGISPSFLPEHKK